MPLDALFLAALTRELSAELTGARIDKIHQPERDEFVLAVRGFSGNRKLLLSAAVGSARAHLINEPRENPASPPMLCMLLRKLLGGGIIREVTQVPAERILKLTLDTTDELGELQRRELIIELIATQPNVILLDSDRRITDCLRRIEGDITTGKRQVLPGLFYHPPEPQRKLDTLAADRAAISAAIAAAPDDALAERWITASLAGFSPLAAREIAYQASGDFAARIGDMNRETLTDACMSAVSSIREGTAQPTLVLRGGEPFDFCYMPIHQYGDECENATAVSFSALIEGFYGERDRAERMRRRSRDMYKTIKSAHERVSRRVETQRGELVEARDRERLRELGDLLMANLHLVGRGAQSVRVKDFYSPDGAEVDIKLDNRITAQQNAAKYYKDYSRRKNAEKMLTTLISEGEREQGYLAAVLNEIANAEHEKELLGIRDELVSTGYIRASGGKGRRKPEPYAPREFVSSGGFRIQVGRDNLQNDRLTLKEAHRNDVWLHAQHAHGAHAVIRCGTEEPDDATYTEAGIIAAYYSEARDGALVAVDYTRARHVKKPAGARPGMVVYDPYFTMYVKPDKETVARLRKD